MKPHICQFKPWDLKLENYTETGHYIGFTNLFGLKCTICGKMKDNDIDKANLNSDYINEHIKEEL